MTKKQKCIRIFEEKIHAFVFPLDVKASDVFGNNPTNYEYKVFSNVQSEMICKLLHHFKENRPKTYEMHRQTTNESACLRVCQEEGGIEFYKTFKY